MGYQLKDLGTHSIRKGAMTYCCGQPGGPPPAAIFLRAGWSMGKVRNVYICWEVGGDQFVDRVLSMANLLSLDLASALL